MIDRNFAERFARDWAAAWNDRDLDAVLMHYADGVVFQSPRISRVLGVDQPSLEGKEALRDYWTEALEKAPRLYFEIDRVLIGSDAVTILYTNHREEYVAETFLFGDDRRVRLSVVAYD